MGATTTITTKNKVPLAFLAEQDKGSGAKCATPAPERPAVGNPRDAFNHDEGWAKSSFAKEISPTIFNLMGDPVFRRHAHLRSLLDRSERAIRRRSGNGYQMACDLLSHCSLVARHYRRSNYYTPKLKPETAMDLSLACAINGVIKEASYEEAHRA